MFHGFLIGIKDITDFTVLGVMILIAIFGFFVDRPAFKRQGLIKDAKITSVISMVLVGSAVAMALIAKLAK
ncbi:CLC_0170 family protein [Lutispora sp.]|uniref:CLC_0170 family protein n=1 Tax=Lutispora sp. TaxID=2828727 RepID=UPI002B20FBCD|nr:CLC_0170 family protein [Lutispora sp.]MEA4963029.1 CLC_0170 family protein [Lutispora sp.]